MFLNANNSMLLNQKKKHHQNKSIFSIGLFKYTFLTVFRRVQKSKFIHRALAAMTSGQKEWGRNSNEWR